MNNDEITKLFDRFLEGDTSPAEEQRLYEAFSCGDLPHDLARYGDMMAGFEALRADDEQYEGRATRSSRLIRIAWGMAAAVIVAVMAIAGRNAYMMNRLDAMYGGSYVIVNGERIDNLASIVGDVESTLRDSRIVERRAANVADVGDVERELLQSISDYELRADVEQLLSND